MRAVVKVALGGFVLCCCEPSHVPKLRRNISDGKGQQLSQVCK